MKYYGGEGQLMAYRHGQFWQGMDNRREKRMLETMWEQQQAPWKVWE
jgi:glucose-1-phosphate cytidylyltransferase